MSSIRKRALSLCLSLALCLGLSLPAAAAASFTDVGRPLPIMMPSVGDGERRH